MSAQLLAALQALEPEGKAALKLLLDQFIFPEIQKLEASIGNAAVVSVLAAITPPAEAFIDSKLA